VNFDDVERLLSKFKTRPIKTAFVVVVFILFVAAIAYISELFREKGKQHALSPASTGQSTTAVPGNAAQRKNTSRDGVTINQRTQGDQSSAIVSGGNVIIQYDTPKDRDKKE
jgi:hypothetical protein